MLDELNQFHWAMLNKAKLAAKAFGSCSCHMLWVGAMLTSSNITEVIIKLAMVLCCFGVMMHSRCMFIFGMMVPKINRHKSDAKQH